MSNHDQGMRRDGPAGGTQYLESAVRAASPAQLRLMLIERAIAVCLRLSNRWRAEENLGVNEDSITLHDLLIELLEGIAGSENEKELELCEKVADLYVFLNQHLVRAQEASDAGAVDEIRAVLEVDAETWRAVCAQSTTTADGNGRTPNPASAGGLDLEG